jgi:hypothetical protein
MSALRRALDGKNMAAMVASAKALLEFGGPPSPPRPGVPDVQRQRHRGASFTRRGGPKIVGGGVDLELIETHEKGGTASPRTVSV